MAGGGPKMTLFMAKTRPKWQGCSRLDRPTWKVSCAPYHTPIHGPFLPFPGTCQGLAGFLCITVIYDLSMLIYGAGGSPKCGIFGVITGSYGSRVGLLRSGIYHLESAYCSVCRINIDPQLHPCNHVWYRKGLNML